MNDLSQFIRAETHPIERSKLSGKGKRRGKQKKGWNAKNIRDEAERRPGAIPHIQKPEAPNLLFGVLPTLVLERASLEIAKRKKALRREHAPGKKVRRIRKDQHVMICGIASYPVDWSGVRKGADDTATYYAWKDDVIQFLRDHYAKAGGELVSVVEHIDERYPHLHFYVLPTSSATFSAREIHDGWREKLEARSKKQGRKEEIAAYSRGTEILRNAFYVAVSQKYGHALHKGKRPRVARNFYASEKRQLARENRLLAESRHVADQKEKQLAQKADEITAQQRNLDNVKVELNSQIAASTQIKDALDHREETILKRENELAVERAQLEAIQLKLSTERKEAITAKAAYQKASQNLLPRVEELLSNVKVSINGMAKIRDRHRTPQSPAEAQSFNVSRAMIEKLEQFALKLDEFICVKTQPDVSEIGASNLEGDALPDALSPRQMKP